MIDAPRASQPAQRSPDGRPGLSWDVEVHVAGNATRMATLPSNCDAAATARSAIRPPPRPDGGLSTPNDIAAMCGRATYKLTWEEIVALDQLTLFQPAANTPAR